MGLPRTALTIGFVVLSGCTVGGGLPSASAEVEGTWGGPHVGLALAAGGGTITYDCAHGTLDAPVMADRRGRFEVSGTHVREHGGPVRAGEVLASQPAIYRGRVSGAQMVLRVVVGPDTLGPFTLRRGVEPQLFRCL